MTNRNPENTPAVLIVLHFTVGHPIKEKTG